VKESDVVPSSYGDLVPLSADGLLEFLSMLAEKRDDPKAIAHAVDKFLDFVAERGASVTLP